GDAAGAGLGGTLSFAGGASPTGNGGNLTFNAGIGGAQGGTVQVSGADCSVSGNGGDANLTGGNGATAGNGGTVNIIAGTGAGAGVRGDVVVDGLNLKVGATQFTPNGAVATALTAVGPTGASTTVQEWF